MRLFRSNKQNISPVDETLSGKLVGHLLKQQSRIAGWLNYKTKSFSSKTWLVLLILFCLIVGSTCLYLIITSIYN